MEAGRELDALVAEKVLDWVWTEHPTENVRYFRPLSIFRYGAIGTKDKTQTEYTSSLPEYSTSLAAAEAVVNEMERRGFWCQMRTPFCEAFGKDGYWAGFTPHDTSGWNGCPDNWTQAGSLPLAICLAALATLEEEKEDPPA